MPRDVLTANPISGDYILRPTGFSWTVLRSIGEGSAMLIAAGDRNKKTALARVQTLSETDRADGWETSGTGMFWQITSFRR
jgi:hypothetical protein